MTFGSLFSGIGGLDLGLERAGMECRWQCEIDPYCRQVLAKHWPNIPCYEDVRKIGDDVERVDLVCGGFPCQDISLQGAVWGKRKGLQGERSGLWEQMFRCVCLVRPQFVLVENVAAFARNGLGEVIGQLSSVGYDAEWDCLPACAFGAPHERYRLFVVAYDGKKRGERIFPQSLPRFSAFPWFKNVRSVEDVRDRPDLPQPLIRGTRDGIPYWVDRLAALGNAVVPQVAEWIGRRIMEAA